MRTLLNKLYLSSGFLAGLCIVSITGLILAQVVGRWFNIVVPSTEDFSGFLLAAASFLALAYTFREAAHIRVTIVISHLHGSKRKVAEIFCLGLLLIFVSYAAWYLVLLVIESYEFEEVTQGYISIPLWIPQVPMALGMIILWIAVVDTFICTTRQQDFPKTREVESS